MSHSFNSWRMTEKIATQQLSDDLYTENTLATKMLKRACNHLLVRKFREEQTL